MTNAANSDDADHLADQHENEAPVAAADEQTIEAKTETPIFRPRGRQGPAEAREAIVASVASVRKRYMPKIDLAGIQEMVAPKIELASFRELVAPKIDLASIRELVAPKIDLASIRELVAPKIDLASIQEMVAPKADLASIQEMVAPKAELASFREMVAPKIDLASIQEMVAPKIDLASIQEMVAPKIDLASFRELVAPKADLRYHLEPLMFAGITAGIEALVPRIDLGAFENVSVMSGILASFRDIGSPLDRVLKLPDFTATFVDLVPDLRSAISSLIGDWHVLAGCGHTKAARGMRAALRARWAVLHHRIDLVVEFARTWLGIRRIDDAVVEAVSAALIDATWDFSNPESAMPSLETLVKRHRRSHKSIFAIYNGYRPILSLDKPIADDGSTLVDVLGSIDQQPTDFQDDRVNEVLELLNPIERAVAERWAAGGRYNGRGITWADAAVECGQDPSFGNAVRRKLKRIGVRVNQRRAS